MKCLTWILRSGRFVGSVTNRNRGVQWIAGTGALCFCVMSCVTVNRVIMAPPAIPGATFLGSESCEDCHDSYTRDFHTATHSLLMAETEHSNLMGCEGRVAFTWNRGARFTRSSIPNAPQPCAFNATSTNAASLVFLITTRLKPERWCVQTVTNPTKDLR